MTHSPFRGALIGCGFFARNHMHGWRDADGAEIVAVCDTDAGRAAAFAAEFGARAYTDAARMLAETAPDFVDIATTVETHRPLVELALGHGALTICQKPFAPDYADGLAMVEAARAANRPLLVHENFRWQKPFRLLKEHVRAGSIGTPRSLRLSFRHHYTENYVNQPYLREVADLAIMDVGLHLFDLARFLVGDVTRISCRTRRRAPDVAGEDEFAALLDHTEGALSNIDCCFSADFTPEPFPQTLARIEGDAGTLDLMQDYRLHLHGRGTRTEFDAEPAVPTWGEKPWHAVQESVTAFEAHVVEVLRGTAEPQPSGAHNLDTLALALAAYRSAATGQSVDMAAFIAGGARR